MKPSDIMKVQTLGIKNEGQVLNKNPISTNPNLNGTVSTICQEKFTRYKYYQTRTDPTVTSFIHSL